MPAKLVLSQLSLFVSVSLLSMPSATYLQNLRAAEVDYASDIQTILARRCYSCHGPDQQESSLRLDLRESVIAEADSGLPAIVQGNSGESELIQRVLSKDEDVRMPPEGKPLSEREVELLKRWIDSGAEYSQHWAFQPIQTPKIPEVQDRSWSRNAIDRLVLHPLEEEGLAPVAEAEPGDLVRRLYLDVTGVPPSPETVAHLVSNWSDQAYEQLVDKLLADAAFGERWARNWLDVVRFAETNSFERDSAKPNAWKYRDYVIRAMCEDKPYDQFIREQIAGDELEEVTHDSLTATGYYRLGIWDDEPADPKQAIFDGFDDLVSTTSQGILALTLNCARCHDHKIDPLTQKDYYSMVAFMRDVTPYGTRNDQRIYSQIDLDPDVAERYDSLQVRKREIEKQTLEIEQSGIKKMSSTDQRATEGGGRRKVLKEKLQQHLDTETYSNYQALQKKLREVVRQQKELPSRDTVLGLAKIDAEPKPTYVLLRGSPHAEGEEVDLAFPKLLGGGGAENLANPAEGAKSSGRRRALAEWLTSKDNWLTSRVIVNRIWLHYFGRGIVRSPNNFGLMGDTPTHPELINYLATELMDHDWSLKSVHRAILLSSTYRLSTQTSTVAAEKDPANDLFWRQNLKRLSAEQVRDSVLAVSGQLNRQQFGPSMFPSLSAEVLASQSKPGNGWGDSPKQEQARRSIYIHVKRSLPVPMLSAFDFPETDISCEARFLTTQPGQALTMLNSDWMQSQAQHFLDRVQRDVGDAVEDQARRCLELALSKPADPKNVAELIELTQKLKQKHDLSEEAARRAMCLVALNLTEFLYIE